ncbi:hypothetical protein J3F83DRAFT_392728 [Trichoderma novae-zelandiae]
MQRYGEPSRETNWTGERKRFLELRKSSGHCWCSWQTENERIKMMEIQAVTLAMSRQRCSVGTRTLPPVMMKPCTVSGQGIITLRAVYLGIVNGYRVKGLRPASLNIKRPLFLLSHMPQALPQPSPSHQEPATYQFVRQPRQRLISRGSHADLHVLIDNSASLSSSRTNQTESIPNSEPYLDVRTSFPVLVFVCVYAPKTRRGDFSGCP